MRIRVIVEFEITKPIKIFLDEADKSDLMDIARVMVLEEMAIQWLDNGKELIFDVDGKVF